MNHYHCFSQFLSKDLSTHVPLSCGRTEEQVCIFVDSMAMVGKDHCGNMPVATAEVQFDHIQSN